MDLVWLTRQTFMLHQWHPKRHLREADPTRRREAAEAWERNHELARTRQTVVRNLERWGGAP
jgi:hypothetical protein